MSAPSGTGHVTTDGHRDQLRVRARQHRRHDALTDVTVGDAVADLADRARALVADDVRRRRSSSPPAAVQRVAALDADRLDLDRARRRDRTPGRGRPRSGTPRAGRSRSTRRLSRGALYDRERVDTWWRMGRQVSNSFDVLHARTSQPARPDRPLHAAFVQRAKHRYSIHPHGARSGASSSSDLPLLHPPGRAERCGRELRRPHRIFAGPPAALTEFLLDLARAMGIPAHDAARQVMELVESRAMLTPCGSSTSGW